MLPSEHLPSKKRLSLAQNTGAYVGLIEDLLRGLDHWGYLSAVAPHSLRSSGDATTHINHWHSGAKDGRAAQAEIGVDRINS